MTICTLKDSENENVVRPTVCYSCVQQSTKIKMVFYIIPYNFEIIHLEFNHFLLLYANIDEILETNFYKLIPYGIFILLVLENVDYKIYVNI